LKVNNVNINRADSQAIQAEARNKLLAEFGVSPDALVGRGSEAEVYALDEHTVLKLYAGLERLAHFETLQRFYDELDTSACEIPLPRILEIRPFDQLVALVETKLQGAPLEAVLTQVNEMNLHHVEDLYLDAVCALKTIKLSTPPKTYLLFDDNGSSAVATQSFATYYATLVAAKLATVGEPFAVYDPSFAVDAAALVAAIRTGPSVSLTVVHGDFFPGNVLVNAEATQVTGIIDFGSYTLFGDHLLDLAGAFGFYQMYHPARRAIRQRLLPRVLARIEKAETARFFQYLLANAIVTSDLYLTGSPHEDGHFRWAAEIVAEQEYWEHALSS